MNLTRRDGSPLWPNPTPLVVAEFGVSHCGSFGALMAALPRYTCAGAYKFQYHVAELEMLPGHKLYEKIRSLEIPLDKLREAFRESKRIGMLVACTAFSPDTLAELLPLLDAGELDYIKIGSGENDNPIMLDMAARSGHPTVVSLGMGGDPVVVESFGFRGNGLGLMSCVSQYPSNVSTAVAAFQALVSSERDRPCGISAHVPANSAAALVEWCSTLPRVPQAYEFHVSVSPDSPDAVVELCESRLEVACRFSRWTGAAAGSEDDVASWARHVFVARRLIQPGEVVTLADLTSRRASR